MLHVLSQISHPILYGVALSTLSFRGYAYQREVLKGDNKSASFYVFLSRLVLIFVLMTTMGILAPSIGLSVAVLNTASWIVHFLNVWSALYCGLWALVLEKFCANYSVPLFNTYIPNMVDWCVRHTPSFLMRILDKCLRAFYQKFGAVWFATQIILFTVAIFFNGALVSVSALAVFGLAYLRAHNRLPGRFAKMFERFSYWVGLLAGVFLGYAVLQLFAILSILYEFAANMILPKLLGYWLGDSAVLKATRFVNKERVIPEPAIPADISKAAMEQLVQELKKHLIKTESSATHKNVRSEERSHLFQETTSFFVTYGRELKAELRIIPPYQGMTDAWANLRLDRWFFYYFFKVIGNGLTFIVYGIKPAIKKSREVLTRQEGKGAFVMTEEHMQDIVDFVPPPGPVDFQAFQRSVEASFDKVTAQSSSFLTLKSLCSASPKFHKIDPLLADAYDRLSKIMHGFSRERFNRGEHSEALESYRKAHTEAYEKVIRELQEVQPQLAQELVSSGEQNTQAWKKQMSFIDWMQLSSKKDEVDRLDREYEKILSDRGPYENYKAAEQARTEIVGQMMQAWREFFERQQATIVQMRTYRGFKKVFYQALSFLKAFFLDENLMVGEEGIIRRRTVEETVILNYLLRQKLPAMCLQFETGRDILWDKTQGSFATFQSRAKHLVLYMQWLLARGNDDAAHNIIGVLLIDGGDYCGTGIYDVVQNLYDQYVLRAYAYAQKDKDTLTTDKVRSGDEALAAYGQEQGAGKAQKLTAYGKLGYYLQQERQMIFESLYVWFKDNPTVKWLFPTLDFNDRHTHSGIMQGLSMLNLEGSFNAETDLSNNEVSFVDQLCTQALVYPMARVFMALPHGYSPEHMIERSITAGGELALFQYSECSGTWIQRFTDSSVREYLEDLSLGCRLDEDLPLDMQTKLVPALMFLDFHVMKARTPELQKSLGAILAEARKQKAALTPNFAALHRGSKEVTHKNVNKPLVDLGSARHVPVSLAL